METLTLNKNKSDQELFFALKTNPSAGFAQLVKQYERMVINTCYSFVHDATEAEDLAQDVFIEIFESIHGFNKKSKLSTWIYKIAVNKSLDLIKYKKRKRRFALTSVFGVDKEADTITDFTQPDLDMEQKEKLAILHTAIDKLPEKQKIAFNLSKIDELSYAQIAEVMNVSVSSVESLLFRAKKNLKSLLEKFYLKNM